MKKIERRKSDHIEVTLKERSCRLRLLVGRQAGPRALPEVDMEDIDTS